jgi:hypothetical protein
LVSDIESRWARSDPDLGLEHCVIGFPQKILTIAPLSHRRDSHADRDSKLRQVALACGLLECLRQCEGIGRMCRQEGNEFITTKSCHERMFWQGLFQYLSKADQRLIANIVPNRSFRYLNRSISM